MITPNPDKSMSEVGQSVSEQTDTGGIDFTVLDCFAKAALENGTWGATEIWAQCVSVYGRSCHCRSTRVGKPLLRHSHRHDKGETKKRDDDMSVIYGNMKIIGPVGQVSAEDLKRVAEAPDSLTLLNERDSLRQRVSELEKDKERLDWLQHNEVGLGWPDYAPVNGPPDKFFWVFTNDPDCDGFSGKSLRSAIDAAIATETTI